MDGRPIDFHGMLDLDPKIVEHLEFYLNEKESRLAHQLLHALREESSPVSCPVLPESALMRMSDAVESFTKHLRQQVRNGIPTKREKGESELPIKEINCALWDYTEVLEGCVIELFQQVKQLTLDKWHISLAVVVHAIKENLLHRIEDLIWGIRRLDKSLEETYFGNQGLWTRLFSHRGTLDPDIIRNLQRTESFLKSRFASFKERYNEFLMLNIQAEESVEKIKGFGIFALLGSEDQQCYLELLRLLKVLELNPNPKQALGEETSRAIKIVASVDHVLSLFRLYANEIQRALFQCSLQWKLLNPEEKYYPEAASTIKDKAGALREELRMLMHTMSKYRTFLLKHDANPYVRSRLGFSEWTVGPEPPRAKLLADLLFSTEELDQTLLGFHQSLDRDGASQQNIEFHAQQQIEKLLHEMGQPLISRPMMSSRSEQFLEAVRSCDEIGSPQLSTVFYIGEVLSKALRADWKYHVLHESPQFHRIYKIHKGLEEEFEDPAHAFRLERFKALFTQILKWIESGDIYAHVHEIELDMNDMKAYLQDFFATIQRAGNQKDKDPLFEESVCNFRQQLLEYRYLFGQFFSSMINMNPEGQQLRQQFLFVDQYFESIEHLLKDLKVAAS
jgi:hypothetical protein